MKKTIAVVGAILIHHDKILCAQRGPNKSLANFWEFPGGKIENGESPQAALERELTEELRIEVKVEEQPFLTVQHEYDFGIVELTTFICHLLKGTPQLTEHIAIKWLTADELPQLNFAPADLPTIEKLQNTQM